LKEILLDVLTKLGRYTGKVYTNRILFAPDNDISNGRIPSMKSASCNTSSKNSSVSAIFSRFKLASSLVAACPLLNIIEDNNCTQDATTSLSEENFQATSLYFKKIIVPPLLCRHPPPAQGRDDDISHFRLFIIY
jgi:hypothetical protein